MGESPKIAEPLELQGRNHVQAKETLNLGSNGFCGCDPYKPLMNAGAQAVCVHLRSSAVHIGNHKSHYRVQQKDCPRRSS